MMPYVYRPSLRRMFLFLGALSFVFAPFYIVEFFYPTMLGLNGLAFLAFALCCIVEGSLMIYAALKLETTTPQRLCKYVSRAEFIALPILTLFVLSVSAIFPNAERDWLYFLNIGLTSFHILLRLLILFYLNYLMRRGETGLLPIRNHVYIGMSLLFVVLNYYVFAIVKTIGVDMRLLFEDGFAGLSEYFLIMSALEITVGIMVLLQAMFLSAATHFSGKEGNPIDFHTNRDHFKDLIDHYQIPNIISIFATFVLFIISLMSTFTAPAAYGILTLLYFLVLVIRMITFVVKQKLGFSHYGPKEIFTKEHVVYFVAGAIVLAYAVLSIFFMRRAIETIAEAERTMFMTFGIMIPWSVIKMFLGVRHWWISHKHGDPLETLNSYIDLLLSAFTIATALSMVANRAHLPAYRIIAIVLAILVGGYCFYLALKMLIVAFFALKGKRSKTMERFLAFFSRSQARLEPDPSDKNDKEEEPVSD